MSPPAVLSEPDIFSYFDYQQYLRDYYSFQKENNPFFSFRYIAGKVGIDHSLIIKIFQGSRHIAEKNCDSFIRLIGLTGNRSEYFKVLISYNKAEKEKDIKELFEKLLTLLPTASRVLQSDQYEYFQHWYYAAMRSLFEYYVFVDDYSALAKKLSPAITVSQAKEAVRLLINLGLIVQDPATGRHIPASAHISSGEKWRSAAISQFQRETILLAAEAGSRYNKKETDISTITMSMNHEGMQEIREVLRECRKKIIAIVDRYPADQIDTLYQLNMQLFPLVKQEIKP